MPYFINHMFIFTRPWNSSFPSSCRERFSSSKTTFIAARVVPAEGTAEVRRSRSFYLLKTCKDSVEQVQMAEEPGEQFECNLLGKSGGRGRRRNWRIGYWIKSGSSSRRRNRVSHRSITENRLQAIYWDYVLLRTNLEAEVLVLPLYY